MIKYLENTSNMIFLNDTIENALQILDNSIVKILFVVDNEMHLLASLTDGDIRRAIVSRISLDTEVSLIAHKNPIVITEETKCDVDFILKSNHIIAAPYVDENKKLVGTFYSDATIKYNSEEVSCPIVIMAGGKGTRLYPFTKILPKPLIPIEGIPISERIIREFKKNGCDKFYMVINYKREMIKSYYSESDLEVNFVVENEVLGTGGGIKLLQDKISETFIMTNCDIMILEDVYKIMSYHEDKGYDVTIVSCLKNFEIPYGVINYDEYGEVIDFREKPKYSFFTNTGLYVVNPIIFEYIDNNEQIGMPEVLERMKNDGLRIGIYPIGENAWLDMGQFESMESMERKVRELGL